MAGQRKQVESVPTRDSHVDALEKRAQLRPLTFQNCMLPVNRLELYTTRVLLTIDATSRGASGGGGGSVLLLGRLLVSSISVAVRRETEAVPHGGREGEDGGSPGRPDGGQ